MYKILSRFCCILLLTICSLFSGCSREYIITSKYRFDIIETSFPVRVNANTSLDPSSVVQGVCFDNGICDDYSIQNSASRKGEVLEENDDEAIDLFEEKVRMLDQINWEAKLREVGFTAVRGSFLFVLQSIEDEELVVFRQKKYEVQF